MIETKPYLILLDSQLFDLFEEVLNYKSEKESDSKKFEKILFHKSEKDSLDFLKKYPFTNLYIIIGDKLYKKFIFQFSQNLKDYALLPKIIIFSKDKEKFIKENQDINFFFNHPFYNSGGIQNSFEKIKSYILNDKIELEEINYEEDLCFSFEYIDAIEKLYLPVYFKSLIKLNSSDNYDKFTKYLYEKYSRESALMEELINSILPVSKVPLEILCKFYARAYTIQCNFYKNMNNDLIKGKKENYLTYIKVMYEGIKLEAFKFYNSKLPLYRSNRLKKKEIMKIEEYLRKKKEEKKNMGDLPSIIIFSKAFLSFSKEKSKALEFLKKKKKSDNDTVIPTFFILENSENILENSENILENSEYEDKMRLSGSKDINSITYIDLDEELSIYPQEKEVLFFPFSCFEIKKIEDGRENDIDCKIIKLNYLTKYESKIKEYFENNKDKINESFCLLKDDDIFYNEFKQFQIAPQREMKNLNPQRIIEKFEEYKEEIIYLKENKDKKIFIEAQKENNYIICEYKIDEKNVNKKIHILNCYEEYKKENNLSNEYILQDNIYEIDYCEIYLKDNENYILLDFDYKYEFKKKGTYTFKFKFIRPLENLKYLFADCHRLISVDFSNFNSEDIINIEGMFYACEELKTIKFSNFNTNKVTNMSFLFCGCFNLEDVDLSNFRTQKVTTMKYMFSKCKSIEKLDLSKFNTQNLEDGSFMFDECKIKKFYLSKITERTKKIESIINELKKKRTTTTPTSPSAECEIIRI